MSSSSGVPTHPSREGALSGPVVITGAAGFLGSALVEELSRKFLVRGTDLRGSDALDPGFCGDLSDRDFVLRLMQGAGGLVLNHMYPRGPGAYEHPSRPFDVNVTAVASLFDAAVRVGCRKVVLISSIGVVGGSARSGGRLDVTTAAAPLDIYGLTKSLQESVAEFYHRCHGISVAILRPAYVTDEDTMCDKYGREKSTVNWQFVDRRDIAAAAGAALNLTDLGLETFFITGHPDGESKLDMEPARRRLGWQPRHPFTRFPVDRS